MNSYGVVIFDWDGTLVDSQAQIVRHMQTAFKQLGLEPPSTYSIRQIIGLSIDIAIRQLYPDADNTLIKQITDAYRNEYYAAPHSEFQLFDGTLEMLDAIREQSIYLAVATGKSRRGLDHELDQFGISNYFSITRCADETRSKPNPLMLQEILIDLDLTIDKALMVGDTSYDLDMANAIGMASIAVTWGMHSSEQLLACNPAFIIDSFEQLKPLVSDIE
ncbi:MAG: phosphoglycolate phosphatase [Gammaproteobacteria bacterium]|jgi:phosphoglycolate phosphatase